VTECNAGRCEIPPRFTRAGASSFPSGVASLVAAWRIGGTVATDMKQRRHRAQSAITSPGLTSPAGARAYRCGLMHSRRALSAAVGIFPHPR